MESMNLLNPRGTLEIIPQTPRVPSPELERLSKEIIAPEGDGHPARTDNPAYAYLSEAFSYDFYSCDFTQPRQRWTGSDRDEFIRRRAVGVELHPNKKVEIESASSSVDEVRRTGTGKASIRFDPAHVSAAYISQFGSRVVCHSWPLERSGSTAVHVFFAGN
jgi:hypothetical protein